MTAFFTDLAKRATSSGKRPLKPHTIIAITAVAVLISGVGTALSSRWGFALNETESLPNWAFAVDKADRAPKRGEYFVFVARANPYYPAGMQFTKKVVGVPGDIVTVTASRDFFINGQFVGHAKERSKRGDIAVMSDPGVIPAGHYFVVTPHPDSLDSRYKMIGLIDHSRLVGKASPVM